MTVTCKNKECPFKKICDAYEPENEKSAQFETPLRPIDCLGFIPKLCNNMNDLNLINTTEWQRNLIQ